MRPGTPLSIDVTTRSGATLTVAAVDEGILQLVAQKTPDPYGEFYAKRELAVSSYDTFCMLLPEVPPLQGKSLAGGGDSMEDLSKFLRSESPASKLVAFWSGLVTADGQGKARSASTSRNSGARCGSWWWPPTASASDRPRPRPG
jgi:uncharacterized protein YfaS (alpha-2-macroglobulin family)